MALSHVAFLPGSMQVGQHSPAGVKGKWQSTRGQVIWSQTTRPSVHRQVMQGLGDQTAWLNMVRPWYTHWPCLPESKRKPQFTVKKHVDVGRSSPLLTQPLAGKIPVQVQMSGTTDTEASISLSHSSSETWPRLSFPSSPATTDPAAVIAVWVSPNLKPVLYHHKWTKQWLGPFPPLFLHWLHLPTWSLGADQNCSRQWVSRKDCKRLWCGSWGLFVSVPALPHLSSILTNGMLFVKKEPLHSFKARVIFLKHPVFFTLFFNLKLWDWHPVISAGVHMLQGVSVVSLWSTSCQKGSH